MVWIDYRKASDKVPHSWVTEFLEWLGINDKVIRFTEKGMTTWKTRMRLQTESKVLETEDIKYNVGYCKETHCRHWYFASV